MTDRTNSFFRWLAYAMEIAVVFTLGATPGLLPEIYGAKPTLLLCVALTVAIFERELPAMTVGAVTGVLIDLGFTNSIGVFTITLTVICFIVGYAANNLIMATFLNFLLYAAVTVSAVFLLYFLIRFVWSGVDDRWVYFRAHILSRMIQTFVFSIPFYFLNKLIYATLNTED